MTQVTQVPRRYLRMIAWLEVLISCCVLTREGNGGGMVCYVRIIGYEA
jgi:hypothetical protein